MRSRFVAWLLVASPMQIVIPQSFRGLTLALRCFTLVHCMCRVGSAADNEAGARSLLGCKQTVLKQRTWVTREELVLVMVN